MSLDYAAMLRVALEEARQGLAEGGIPIGAALFRADGTLLGAGLGALIGSQIGSGKGQMAAIAVGVLAGAWAGSEVGKSLDKADRAYAERTAQDSLEYAQIGQAKAWRNPDSGNSGTFTPTRTYRTQDGANCRDFETTIYVDGEQETGTGRACRQSDGTWQIVG